MEPLTDNPPESPPSEIQPHGRPRQWFWLLPALLALVMAGGAVGAWQYDRWKHQRELVRETDSVCKGLAHQIESTVRDRMRPLRRVRNDIRDGRITTEAQFREGVKSLQVVLPILPAMARINGDGTILTEPPSASPIFADVPKIQEQLEGGAEWCSGVKFDEAGPYVIVMLKADRAPAGGPDATLAAKTRLGELLRTIISTVPERYQACVRDQAGAEVLSHINHEAGDYQRTEVLWVMGRPWTVTLQSRTPPHDGPISAWTLVGGLLLSLALPGALWQWLRQKWKETQGAHQQVRDLAALAEESVRLSTMLGTGQDLFGPVLEASLCIVGLPIGLIAVLQEEGRRVRVQVSRGLDPAPAGQVLRIEDVPMLSKCVDSGELIVSEDQHSDPRPFNREILRQYPVRSVMMIPLTRQKERVGVLVLHDTVRRRFGQREIQLARLWGAQASAILTDHQLWEQMSQALEGHKRLLKQREILYDMHQRLYALDGLEPALQDMVNAAPAAFGVDYVGISMLEPGGDTLRIAAATGGVFAESPVGVVHPGRIGITGAAITSGKVTVTEDAAGDARMIPEFRERLRVGSMIAVPLIAGGGERLGVMVLVRHAPSRIAEDLVLSASVFGGRVAQVIQVTRLLHQTRRDADMRAMLLRELSHRVNNNLAAIVGLLSAGPADLPASATQWLDRVLGRIVTMARTHDMFLDPSGGATLEDVVRNVLESLTVFKQPGVDFRTELPEVSKEVTISQAVALAMVLHELCANALQHGIGERGVLTIRGSIAHDRVIQIDVIDDGSSKLVHSGGTDAVGPRRSIEAVSGNGGIGLQLVRELVRRELKGEFWSEARDGGGTIACVRFGAGFTSIS